VSQMGAWHQDGLADWLSFVMWLRLRLGLTEYNSGVRLQLPT
jgi:hypothetical protein